jgi:hypothetical protein
MHPTNGRSSRRPLARSSRFPKWAACITATSDARRHQTRPISRHQPATVLCSSGRPPWPPRSRAPGHLRQPDTLVSYAVSSVSSRPPNDPGRPSGRAGHGIGEGQPSAPDTATWRRSIIALHAGVATRRRLRPSRTPSWSPRGTSCGMACGTASSAPTTSTAWTATDSSGITPVGWPTLASTCLLLHRHRQPHRQDAFGGSTFSRANQRRTDYAGRTMVSSILA